MAMSAAARWAPLTALALAAQAMACGMSVHNEVARRAASWFDPVDHPQYAAYLQAGMQWLQPGTFMPDWGYAFDYADESEHAHWPAYLNTTVSLLKAKYPRPWGRAVQDKAVFVLGVVAHAVADTSWHSLGMPAGLIAHLANIEHGSGRNDAHGMADTGGEFVLKHFSDVDYIEPRWFTPADDLAEAYALDGFAVSPDTIAQYMKVGHLGAMANRIAGELLFRYAEESPGVIDIVQNYYTGGLNDMATWTQICWEHVVAWLETDVARKPYCKIMDNHWAGNGKRAQLRERYFTRDNAHEAEAFLASLGFASRSGKESDIAYSEIYRLDGVDVDTWMKDMRTKKIRIQRDLAAAATTTTTTAIATNNKVTCETDDDSSRVLRRFASTVSFSQLGFSLAAGDFNGDGRSELAIGAPAHGTQGLAQRGTVFIVDDVDDGASSGGAVETIEDVANITLAGADPYGRFGYALAVVDLNADGVDDLAVSAPSTNLDELYYDGRVYVFFGRAGTGLPIVPSITLTVTQMAPEPARPPRDTWSWNFKHTALGTHLSAADVDGDGYADLIVGSPYASTSMTDTQRGTVLVFKSSSLHMGTLDALSNADIVLTGSQDWALFGSAVTLADVDGNLLLVVGEPGFNPNRQANRPVAETPAYGRLYAYRLRRAAGREDPALAFTISGNERLLQLGAALTAGTFFDNTTQTLALATPAENTADHWQAGVIRIISIQDFTGDMNLADITPLTILRGSSNAGRLGAGALHVANGKFWVGEPLFGSLADIRGDEDIGLESGRTLTYSTGPSFPTGDVSAADAAQTCVRGTQPKERLGWSMASLARTGAVAIGAPHAYTLTRLGGQVVLIRE